MKAFISAVLSPIAVEIKFRCEKLDFGAVKYLMKALMRVIKQFSNFAGPFLPTEIAIQVVDLVVITLN